MVFFVCFVLVLARNEAQMTGLAEHLPIQRVAAMFVWFRRELDDTDLQDTQDQGSQPVVRGSVQPLAQPLPYLTSVAVLMVGVTQALDDVAVSTVFFWND